MKRSKITVDDIRAIKAGESKIFYTPSARDIRSAQVTAYRMPRFEPELGVKFSTSTDFDNLSITITAIKNQ